MRERSRSPVEAKSSRDRDSYSRRDYGYSRNSSLRSDGRDNRNEGRRDYDSGRGDSRGDSGRGSRRGGRGRGGRDFSSRRDYNSGYASNSAPASTEDTYRKSDRNYDNSIFIGNIPFESTSRDVEDLFQGKYKIVRADIVTNRGRSRGMATVEFSNKDDVREAITEFDHMDYQGRQIFVRQDYPPPEKKEERDSFRKRETYDRRSDYLEKRREEYSETKTETKPGCEIFVGNLPFSVNWQALKDLMRKAGTVTRADVRTDDWGKSRGFGTVVFSSEEEAAAAVEMFQGYEIEGRRLDTRPGRGSAVAKGRDAFDSRTRERPTGPDERGSKNSEFTEGVTGDGEKSDTVHVANLPFVTNNDDLYELFETIGRTTKAEIQYNSTGKPLGGAVVQFELPELAESAIASLDNYLYGGRNLKITYAKRP